MTNIENMGQQAIGLLFISIILLIVLFGALMWFGWWVTVRRGAVSPYTKKPMMLGVDLPKSIALAVEEFMKSLPQPENSPFDCTKAAICRDTGRIFPDAVKRGEIIRLGWEFLQNRYPGTWVSWGSLSETEKGVIRLCHRSLRGFQMENSCPRRNPQEIDSYYASLRPGPLYIHVAKKTFLGWKVVPGTYFEVLVVQKPDYETIEDTL